MILGEGRGFEIAQGRLGPGRIHHCMRSLGAAESALALMCSRASERESFGRRLMEFGTVRKDIAESRADIEQARQLTLLAAHKMDEGSLHEARKFVSMIKFVAPNAALRVIDRCIQLFGAAGVSDDFPLARSWATLRTLRIADGPDEVHHVVVAKAELSRHSTKSRL